MCCPPEVIARPKHGFNVPIDHWLKNDWADLVEERFRQDSALNREGILAPGAAQAAQAMLHDEKRLNGHTIFCMIMLNKWLEQMRTEIIAEIGQNHNGDMAAGQEADP